MLGFALSDDGATVWIASANRAEGIQRSERGGPWVRMAADVGVKCLRFHAGTLFSLATALAPDDSCVSTTVGWMQQLSACGQFVGPPLVGWVASQAGDWRWTWLVTGCCAAVGMALAMQIAREVRR